MFFTYKDTNKSGIQSLPSVAAMSREQLPFLSQIYAKAMLLLFLLLLCQTIF